jgi:diadenosine tetraphosphate (Ap4A) HIT family hydrolase
MPKIAKYFYGRLVDDSQEYRQYQKSQSECVFCKISDPNNTINKILEQNDNFWVIKNLFPYAMFDSIEVVDHLLIVPKQHVESVDKLSKSQRAELIELICRYEDRGYNWMARSASNQAKSVSHQHTHLIKTI